MPLNPFTCALHRQTRSKIQLIRGWGAPVVLEPVAGTLGTFKFDTLPVGSTLGAGGFVIGAFATGTLEDDAFGVDTPEAATFPVGNKL